MLTLIRHRLQEGGALWRLALVAAGPAVLLVGFIVAAGWLSPGRLTPATFMQTFHRIDGAHPGFRRNHAKGLCVTGWFAGSGVAEPYSRAALFAKERSPVVGRFALAGGMPEQADAPGKVRSLALRIMPANGQEWRMGINDIPVFLSRTAADFNAFMLATRPDPATGKPDGARVGAFLAAHPETARALGLLKARTLTSGFGNDTYNSLNTFLFVNAEGRAVPVRWAMVSDQTATPPGPNADDRNYLFDDLIAALDKGPLHWTLRVTLGQPGDPTADSTQRWPDDRKTIDAGRLTLIKAESEDGGPCLGLTYDPTILPEGITVSDDPIPAARSAVYARSFTLRSGESKPPSAITPADVRKGG